MRRSGAMLVTVIISFVLSLSTAFADDDMALRLNAVLSKSATEKFWQVSAEDVKAMIEAKKTDFLIVDVRPVPVLYNKGHIPGSIYIPTQDVLQAENLAKLPKDKKLILVCVTGQTQNLPVVALRALGYDAWTMKFGMASWDRNSVGVKFMKEALEGAERNKYPLEK